MYTSKKTRIISFLMCLILVFSFAFINPLTISKSYAFAPAAILSTQGVKIIAGVLASAGIGITAGTALQEIDYDSAVTAVSNVIYRTLDGSEKIALGALSIIDNIVEVPIALYNSIIDKAETILFTSETMSGNNITTKYYNFSSSNSLYTDINIPIYCTDVAVSTGKTFQGSSVIDTSEMQPIMVYDGFLTGTNKFDVNAITSFIFKDLTVEETLYDALNSITPSLEAYNIPASGGYNTEYISFRLYNSNTYAVMYLAGNGNQLLSEFIKIDFSNTSLTFATSKFYVYLLYDISNNVIDYLIDFYDSYDVLKWQTRYSLPTSGGLSSIITPSTLTDTPFSNTNIELETTPTSVITNADTSANVLTLPAEVSGAIGLTSTQVNVEVNTDTPGTDIGSGENTGTNTETLDNINTNVGDLVTGGELGEQVNTNIGTVEGLHGEITEQVDFGAVFDTITEYISALDISSVTWFPVAVASFITPFLPLISLGIILFFIDRVLNGGA